MLLSRLRALGTGYPVRCKPASDDQYAKGNQVRRDSLGEAQIDADPTERWFIGRLFSVRGDWTDTVFWILFGAAVVAAMRSMQPTTAVLLLEVCHGDG